MQSENVAELVTRCIQGDGSARAQLFADHIELVRWAVHRRLSQIGEGSGTRADVEDISNEIFERLLSNDCVALTRLRNPQSLRAWLVTIAQNRTVDWLRKQQTQARTRSSVAREAAEEYSPAPSAHLLEEERLATLRAGLAQLPAVDRLILELYFLQGLTYAEIAQTVSMNINTMSGRLRKAKVRLRSLLEGRRDAFTQ